MGTIYHCLQIDSRSIPPQRILRHEAKTEADAMRWLEENGGGTYRNILHNFDLTIPHPLTTTGKHHDTPGKTTCCRPMDR